MTAKKISNEARRIVERYLRKHGDQTALALWGEPLGSAADSAQDPVAEGGASKEGEAETP